MFHFLQTNELVAEFKRGNFFEWSAVEEQFVGVPDSVHAGALQADVSQRRRPMPLGTILLIILIVLLVGALPTWPYSGGWGYYPSGGLGLVLVIVLILLLLGRI
jgi:peptidoglycan/LPS O-acetylase OafA/YrhL